MPLSKEILIDSYTRMKTIRVFEERVHQEFERGNIPGFVHLYIGQEASAVGVCMNLEDTDYIGSTHRGHGHSLAKLCAVEGMMKEIFGRRDGLCGGKGGSMHIADFNRGMLGANGIVGANAPLVIGAGLTAKTLNNGGVGVSFIGDGASNQGTTFEAMNMAVVLKLPVIFILENNGYGEGTGHDYAVGSKDMAKRAESFGMPAAKVDGTDFFAVYEAATVAVARARRGEGPSVIETGCPRWHGHYLGDPQLYRSKEEISEVMAMDPVEKFRHRVLQENTLDVTQLNAIDTAVQELVNDAAEAASEAAFPTGADLMTDVYVS